MKFKLEKSESSFNEQIEENKELLISVSVFLAGALLFIFFILPKILSFPTAVSERSSAIEKLNELRDAKNILQNANSSKIEEEIEVVSKVLPNEKNFELVLGAITEAATEANVQVISYNYSGLVKDIVSADESAVPLLFTIEILGDAKDAADFSEKLMKTYPISETIEVDYVNGLTEIQVAFFYKPFASVNAEAITLAREKSPEEITTYNEIVDWESFNFENIFIEQLSTESASLF